MSLKELIIRANLIVADVKAKKLDRLQAFNRLRKLSKQAWEEEPNSEPDGDIEYTTAIAHDEIDEYVDNLKSKTKPFIYEWLKEFDNDDLSDGAWELWMKDAINAYNKEYGTKLDQHETWIRYIKRSLKETKI